MSRTHVFNLAKEHQCDVAVIGGGTTGIAAAIAAARGGAQTVLIERNGCLGGNSTAIPAWLGFHACGGEPVVAGIPLELLRQLQEAGGATNIHYDPICGSVVGINTHWWKIVAADAVRNNGVSTWLHAMAVDVERNKRRVEAVYFHGREGLNRLQVKQVIDCTDNGMIARLAGETLVQGRSGDHRRQVASWVFEVNNIDFAELMAYFREYPEDLRPFRLKDPVAHLAGLADADVFVMGAFTRLVAKARQEGMKLDRDNMPGIAFPRESRMVSVACRIEDFDSENTIASSQAELDGALQVINWVKFLQRYVPGFRQCQLSGSPMSTGVRETNHLVGRYVLTGDDLMNGVIFDDAIALGGYHLDIHSPDHGGLETRRPPVYSIPYRALQSTDTDNLLMAGRVISATHEAQSSTRVIPISMALGEAAGTAAALAVKHGTDATAIESNELQELLRRNGVLLKNRA